MQGFWRWTWVQIYVASVCPVLVSGQIAADTADSLSDLLSSCKVRTGLPTRG